LNLAAGTEPRPSRGIAHLTILRNESVSLLCTASGEFNAAQDPGVGLFFEDARYLSELQLTLGGLPMVPLDHGEGGYWLSATLTNEDFQDTDGTVVLSQMVLVTRNRSVGPGLSETLTVTNFSDGRLSGPLTVTFAADFEDIFVVRGYEAHRPPPAPQSNVNGGAVTFSYDGCDGRERAIQLRFSPAPKTLTATEASFDLDLPRGGEFRLEISADLNKTRSGIFKDEQARIRNERTQWEAETTSLESSDEGLSDAYHQALDDIAALTIMRGDRRVVAAGVPWFDCLFGRDSLITGLALLRINPVFLRDILFALAESQATDTNPHRDEEPGKIAHELRVGELANIGEVPFGRYYGSVDATPLFVIACREYLRWTGDLVTVRALLPAATRALQWCLGKAASDPGGWLTYNRESAEGLEHQGWKDSHDGICHPDGGAVVGPVALVEVQAYLAAACIALGELQSAGSTMRDRELQSRAKALLREFPGTFTSGDIPALALDGTGKRVDTLATNCGHALWTGACNRSEGRRVGLELVGSRLFSGWGLRTLAPGQGAFNPLGYHVGSVWPHDNAIVLEGLKRYGLNSEASQLGSALLEAMLGFRDKRVPELFSGQDRDSREFPTPYPVASRPQAWSAASLPWTIFSLLGVIARDADSLHVVAPALPPWLDWVRLRNIRYGTTSVDLLFHRHAGHTGVEVERHRGPGEVVLSAAWPIPFLSRAAGVSR
jgi:glycogen debranching enzyme